jgi:hypothetical protein
MLKCGEAPHMWDKSEPALVPAHPLTDTKNISVKHVPYDTITDSECPRRKVSRK